MNSHIAVITGASGGVGRIVTMRWLAEGASVVAVDQSQAHLDALRGHIDTPDAQARLATVEADVTTETGAASVFANAEQAFGRPADTLLHLVGGFAMGDFDAANGAETWEKMIALNIRSSYQMFRAALAPMRANKQGWIVGMASRAAVTPPAKVAAYAATKAALIAMAQSLSAEVREEDIHVNVILASTIDTPANRQAMGVDAAVNWVTADDIADATLFLCSDKARAIHGATLEVYAKS